MFSSNEVYDKSILEGPSSEIPSAFDLALNGTKNHPSSEFIKVTDNGLLDPEAFRRLSVSTISSDGRRSRSHSHGPSIRLGSRSPAPPRAWRGRFSAAWSRNRGLILVATSQFFGALMNVTTRTLELEGEGMDPFQILFCRMGITAILCCFYMWYTQVPDFPFGPPGTRKLLVARGLSGFFGIYGMYYSLQYLPMSDATVITFLAPSVAGYACYILIGERFTRKEQIASYIALLGVVMIARPTSFFDLSLSPALPDTTPTNSTSQAPTDGTASDDFGFVPTTSQRLSAVAVSLIGVLGAAGAYTTIRWIGKRAHPLISVNYFATWCTIVSTTVLTVGPLVSDSVTFALPNGLKQWAMLLFLGTCGFVMQFMMTAGMAHEKSNRATNMVYTSMLFALLFDKIVFGTSPGFWSLAGCVCILGSAIWIAVNKDESTDSDAATTLGGGAAEHIIVPDEERGMLSDHDGLPGNDEEHAQYSRTDIELDELR